MNWLDAAILVVVVLLMIDGFNTGMIRKVSQILGIVFGLLLATGHYSKVSNFIISNFKVAPGISDTVSFMAILFIVFIVFLISGLVLGKIVRFTPIRILDRAGGAFIGLGLGILFSGAILLMLTVFPFTKNYNIPLTDSFIGEYTIGSVEKVYGFTENYLPIELPRLAFNPEEMMAASRENSTILSEYRLINFSQLDDSACINCGSPVVFKGYLTTPEESKAPKFICSVCERTSDGCQSFEGHHLLYDRCPAVLGSQGFRTDCGMWPNDDFIRVTQTCPVCGESGR